MANRRTHLRRWLARSRAAFAAELDRRRKADGLYWDEVSAWLKDQGAPVDGVTPDAIRKAWKRAQSDEASRMHRAAPQVQEVNPIPQPASQPKPSAPTAGIAGLLKGERFKG